MLNVSSHNSFNRSYLHTKRAAQEMVRKLAIYTIKLQQKMSTAESAYCKAPGQQAPCRSRFSQVFY